MCLILFTVRSRYNAVNFLQYIHENTPERARQGEVWGVFGPASD